MTIWRNLRVNAAVFLAFMLVLPPLALAQDGKFKPVEPCPLEAVRIKTRSGIKQFTVEVAKTREQLRFGLMFREELAKDHGMLFIWDKDTRVSMWMKNTLIPLDMLFADKTGRIVYIAQNTTPESTQVISAKRRVRAVLELAGGASKLSGIRVGDRILHKDLGS